MISNGNKMKQSDENEQSIYIQKIPKISQLCLSPVRVLKIKKNKLYIYVYKQKHW